MNKSFNKIPHDQLARTKMLEEHHRGNKNTWYSIEQLTQRVIRWHHDRNLINGSSDKDQVLKLSQELGELSDSVCKGNDIKDDIGDMLVVMLNIAERNGVSLRDCLQKAYNDIKDRKGKMVDGIFIKEEDLDTQ
jgi:NTP pyrophosphatase (non-canonical NTP hydrolase)